MNNIFLDFEDKWVAVTSDRKKVVANSESLKDLEKKLKKLKLKNLVITKVLPFNQVYSPNVR